MASRIDYSQNRKLYVGTTAEVTVADGNAIIAGNVGIGTTVPLSLSTNTSSLSINSTRTDLTGGLFLKANDVSKVQLYWSTAGFINEILSGNGLWYTNNALKMELLDGDTGQLTLKAKSGTYGTAAILRLEGTNSSTYGGTVIADSTITSFTDGTAYGAHLAFGLNNTSNVVTERMRIQSNGNVGIGVTGPATKLEVSSSLTSGIKVTNSGTINGEAGIEAYHTGAQAGTAYAGYITKTGAGGTNVGIYTAASGATNNYGLIVGSGNVVVGGTSSNYKFGVTGGNIGVSNGGNIYVGGFGADAVIGYLGNTSGVFTLRSDGNRNISIGSGTVNNSVFIKGSNGNVGIGTTVPQTKLDVDGTFGVSDLPFNTDSVSVLVADETLGADLITNGDFATNTDWTLGTGWSIANGKLTANNPTSYAQQGGVFASGVSNTYKISLTVSNYVSGYFTILTGGSTAQSQQFSANGNYTIAFNTNSPSSTTFHFTHFGSFNGSIENVSVQLITSASNQIQKRELGTGAFGPTPVGAYLPLAGGTMTGVLKLNDAVVLQIGSSADLQLFHELNNSYISNNIGDLTIRNLANDKDIIFQSDDGSGGLATYFTLDGSTTHAYFSNPGNVGIGVTNPGAKLGISDGTIYSIRFSNSAAYNSGMNNGIVFNGKYTSGGDVTDMASVRGGKENTADGNFGGKLTFHTRINGGVDTERMRIDDVGRVGIGTDDPIYTLDVVSTGDGLLSLTGGAKPTMRFRIGTSTVGTIQAQENTYMNVSASGTSSLNLQTAGTTPRLTILNTGEVGINQTAPAGTLHVQDAVTGDTSQFLITNGTGATLRMGITGSGTNENAHILTNSGEDLEFQIGKAADATTPSVIFKSGGNVGIGTNSPNTQLEILNNNDQPATLRLSSSVSDGDAVAAIISFQNEAGGGGVQGRIENIATEDDASYYKFYTDDTSSPSMTLFDSGNMTIAGTLTQNSDVRLKENIKPIESALDKVKQMQGVEFNKINSSTKEIGVVAQEIEKIIPELVLEDKEGIKSVAYGNITAVLIEAIKEQQKQIEELKQQLNK